MRDHHRLHRLTAVFLAVLVALDLAAHLVGGALPAPVTWYNNIAEVKARHLDTRRGQHLDMVFAGTSQTYYGIDATLIDERLGTSSYNAAIPAALSPIQERWLPGEVLPQIHTDLVVWGLSIVDLNDSRNLSGVVSRYDQATATRSGLLPTLDRQLSRWSGLFRYRSRLADPQIWRQALQGKDSIPRRLVRDDGVRIPPTNRQPNARMREKYRRQLNDFTVGGPLLQSARRTITTVHDRGIPVVLVWLPIPDRLRDLLPDPQLESSTKRAVETLANELGVGFIDVSDGFSDDDFLDYTHLAPAGTRRLSSRLADMLGGIPQPAG